MPMDVYTPMHKALEPVLGSEKLIAWHAYRRGLCVARSTVMGMREPQSVG